jgi:hypothetical protein
LFEVIGCEYGIVLVAADVISEVFFAYLYGIVDGEGLTMVGIG